MFCVTADVHTHSPAAGVAESLPVTSRGLQFHHTYDWTLAANDACPINCRRSTLRVQQSRRAPCTMVAACANVELVRTNTGCFTVKITCLDPSQPQSRDCAAMAVDATAQHAPPPPPPPAATSAIAQAGHPLQQTQSQPQQQHQDVESGRVRQARHEVMVSGGAVVGPAPQASHGNNKLMSFKRTTGLETIVDERGGKAIRPCWE